MATTLKKKKKKKKKKKNKKGFHRTHPLIIDVNKEKIYKIHEVYHHYKLALADTAKYQWKLFFQGALPFSKNRNWVPKSLLNARILRDNEYHAVEILNSYLSNRKNDFKRYVERSSLDDETKHLLHTINCWKAWYYRRPEEIQEIVDPRLNSYVAVLELRELVRIEKKCLAGEEIKPKPIPPYLEFPPEIFKLARQIMKAIFKKNHQPTYKNANMKLSANVASIMPILKNPLPKNHKHKKDKKGKKNKKCSNCKECHSAKSFDYWIQFSTLESGKPIFLPLKDYPYFREQLKKGKLCQSLQFNFDSFGQLQIAAIIEKPKFKNLPLEEQEQRLLEQLGSSQPLSGEISLDTGMCIPLATDKGSLHGLSFYEQLLKYDKRLTDLTKELNRQRIPWNSNKRYLRLRQGMRGYIKNEFNRIINRIVVVYRPAKIIIDKLDFRDSHLSRRMNRLLRNFGIGAIKEKLESLSEELGIEIIWINPAYTSRECGHCGYTSKNNRRGRWFKCRLCGYTLHSDVSGARQGKARSSGNYPSLITLETRKEDVFRILARRFVEQFDTIQQKGSGNWLLRLRSKAKAFLQRNPQYKDFLETDVFKKAFKEVPLKEAKGFCSKRSKLGINFNSLHKLL